MPAVAVPLLLVGAGHMGGALVDGWRRAGALAAGDLLIRDPAPGEAASRAVGEGASFNGPLESLKRARTVVLAVKPQAWRPIAQEIAPWLATDALIVSIMAGVKTADLAEALSGRLIVRAMPTTAAAVLEGAVSLWSADDSARAAARALFAPLGAVVDLPEEDLMHVATAASGSAPAFFYALVEALEAAGVASGLPAAAARDLARAALTGAAALLEASGAEAAALRRQVTSPGGVTEAALAVLTGADGLQGLMARTVAAGAARSRALGG